MNTIKKILIFILILSLGIIWTPFESTATITSDETTQIHGATYQRISQDIAGGLKQTIHILGADFNQAPFKVLVGDNYSKTAYGVATTATHANVTESRFDEYLIIGGVNGDFFEGAGVPQEAYIRDGQVISSGIGYPARDVIGFKEDGTMVHGKPVFEGYEMVVVDSFGKERIRVPLKNINATYQPSPYDVYAYFDTFTQTLSSGVNKYVTSTLETKGALPKIYGRGEVIMRDVVEGYTLQTGQMVIMSQNVYLDALIESGDIITVQRKMVGDFEGVRWGIGAYGRLVENGEVLSNIVGIDPTLRHPRTGVGIKSDGSVFFIAVDGRQTGYSNGATLYELADMMKERGAVVAYNLDGGGSTTMVLRNQDDQIYVANQPSGGTPRAVTNSIFLAVQIRFDDKSPHPIPDLSEPLTQPNDLHVDRGILSWSQVDNRLKYEININGQIYETTQTSFDLKQIIDAPGSFEIIVTAIGDGTFFKTSLPSETLTYLYEGPQKLPNPSDFVLSSGILYWDQSNPNNRYQVIVNARIYTISINRFNFNTQNLEPGIHTIEIKALGDGYNTSDSDVSYYQYRHYSQAEKEVQHTLKLVLELLYQRTKR
jgi:hypothetical protein